MMHVCIAASAGFRIGDPVSREMLTGIRGNVVSSKMNRSSVPRASFGRPFRSDAPFLLRSPSVCSLFQFDRSRDNSRKYNRQSEIHCKTEFNLRTLCHRRIHRNSANSMGFLHFHFQLPFVSSVLRLLRSRFVEPENNRYLI